MGARQREVAGRELRRPVPGEVLGQQRDDVGRAVGRVGIGIDERQVAIVRVARVERDVDELVFTVLGEEGLAALRAADEAVLERADAIEARCRASSRRSVPPNCTGSRTWIIAIRPPLMSLSVNLMTSLSPRDDVRRPRPGEAVGLLFFEDGRLLELVGAELHGMPELVGQHDRDSGLPELIDELRQQVGVVVDHEVAVDAVEGVVLDVEVRGLGRAAARDRLGPLGVGGVDPAGERREVAAVQARKLLLPERSRYR